MLNNQRIFLELCTHKKCEHYCNTTSNKCYCRSGYLVSEENCEDKNECNLLNPCAPQATCLNSIGSYTCKCPDGYIGNPYSLCFGNVKFYLCV